MFEKELDINTQLFRDGQRPYWRYLEVLRNLISLTQFWNDRKDLLDLTALLSYEDVEWH